MTLPVLTEYRQSTLRAMEICPRRTRFALETGELKTGWTKGSTNLGTIFHSFVARYMDQLASPEFRPAKQMPTEEAAVIAREVYAESPFTLDHEDFDALIGMAVRFAADFKWDVNRILAKEDPLRVDLLCPDGQVRTVKGQPDLIVADPPRGLIIYDWKTGMAQPKSPKKQEGDGEPVEGEKYLSDTGRYQRLVYGLLALRQWPSAQYAIMWEVPMRFASHGPRYARLSREGLERIEHKLAIDMMRLDQGVEEGPQSPIWEPRPSSKCVHCEVASSCPVPPRMRGEGAVSDQVSLDIEARRFARGKAMYEQAAERLKAASAEAGAHGHLNGAESVRWGPEPDAWAQKGNGRKFGVHPRVEAMESEAAA